MATDTPPNQSTSNRFLVLRTELRGLDPRVSLIQIERTLTDLHSVLLTDITSIKSYAGEVIAQLRASNKDFRFFLYSHPEARSIFRQEKILTEEKLFLGDAFQIYVSSWEIILTLAPNNPPLIDVINKQKHKQLFNQAYVTQENKNWVDESKLWYLRPQLAEDIEELTKLIRAWLENAQEQTLEHDSSIPLAEKKSRREEDKDTLLRLLSNQAVEEETTPPKPTSPLGSSSRQPYIPPSVFSTQPSVEQSNKGSFALDNRAYQRITIQAGFMYNQVLYDILAIYGISDLSFDQLAKIPEYAIIESQIRQQIIANLYSLTSEEITAFKLGDRARLARKIAEQLILSKPGFTVYMEQAILSAPTEAISEEVKNALVKHIKTDGLDHQASLGSNIASYFADYENPHEKNVAIDSGFVALYEQQGFFARTLDQLESEFTYKLQNNFDGLGLQNALNSILVVEKIIRERRDPYQFVAFLTPDQLALVFGLTKTPTEPETQALKSLLIDYWYRYRSLLYQMTGSQELLTADGLTIAAVDIDKLTPQQKGQLQRLHDDNFSQSRGSFVQTTEEKQQTPEKRIDTHRFITVATFTNQKALEETIDATNKNSTRGQLYSKKWRRVFGDDFKTAQIAALNGNQFLLNSMVAQYFKQKEYILAGQLLALQEIITAAHNQKLILEQMAVLASYEDTEQLAGLLPTFSPAGLSVQLNQAQLYQIGSGITPTTRVTNARNLAPTTKNQAAKQLLKVAAQAHPELAAAIKAAELVDKIIPEEKRKWVLPAVGVGVGAGLYGLSRVLFANPITGLFTAGGAALGGVFGGPIGSAGGALLGFKTGQSLTNWLSPNARAASGTVTSTFSSFNRLATTSVGGTVALTLVGSLLVNQTIESALLLPDTFDVSAVDYLNVTKSAQPSRQDDPSTVTYTITIAPTGSEQVTIRSAQDNVTLSYNSETRDSGGPSEAPSSASYDEFKSQLAALVGQPLPAEGVTLTYEIPFDGNYDDASIINTIDLTYDVATKDELLTNQRQTDRASVCFGDCPNIEGCFEFSDTPDAVDAAKIAGAGVTSKAWQESEKEVVKEAFARRAGTSAYFTNLACAKGPIRIYRLNGSQFGGWRLSIDSIGLYDVNFTSRDVVSVTEYTLVHELAHIIDLRNDGLRQGLTGSCPPTYPATCTYIEPFAEAAVLYVIHSTYSFGRLGNRTYNFPVEDPTRYNYIKENVFPDAEFR